MVRVISALLVTGTLTTQAQRVLHFTATSGYDHGTRDVSFAMFTDVGAQLGAEVVNDPTGMTFSDPSALAEYRVIIFSNTSGNNILDAAQRANFEQWVNAGGHVMGLHAATDTYRHSTANGNNTGTWDFYAELIGASVQENPNHVNGTPPYQMMHLGEHPSTANLPDPWLKNEEYYYWEGGYFGPENNVLLEVEETIGPNGQVNSYDAPRPMSWYREPVSGSRVFYTALGHATSNYAEDALFRQHVKDALAWLLESETGIPPMDVPAPLTVMNDGRSITVLLHDPSAPVTIIDHLGRVVHAARSTGAHRIDTQNWSPGLYRITSGDRSATFTLLR